MLVMEGEAGVGKSRLLAAASEMAEEAGLKHYAARAEPGDRGHPLVTAGDLLRSVGILPAETETVFHIGARLLDVLEAATAERPLLVTVDDLHWADAATVGLLGRVARRAPQLPLVLVIALRPFPRIVEVVELVDRLRRDGAVRLPLDPLDETAVLSLAELVLGSAPEDAVTRQLRRAGGNALLVTECLEAIRRGQPAAELAVTVAIGDAVRQVIGPRLGALPMTTRRVLELLAVLNSPTNDSLVAAMLDVPADAVLDALEPARESSLIVERPGTGWWFLHELARDVVYEDAGRERRRTLHLSVGRHLIAAADARASDVAHHLLEGGVSGEELSAWAAKAAEAARSEPEVALRWARLAADESPRGSFERIDRGLGLARALLAAGRVAEARHLLDRIEAGRGGEDAAAGGEVDVAIARLRLRTLVADGRPDAVIAFARATFGDGKIEQPLARAEAAWELLGAEDVDGAIDGVESLLAGGAPLEPEVEILALTVVGIASGLRGAIDVMCERLSAAVALVEQHPHPDVLHLAPQPFLSQGARYRGDISLAMSVGRRGVATMEELGVAWPLPHAHQALAQALAAAGLVDEAVAEWEAALSAIEEGGTPVPRAFIQLHLAHVDLHREDVRSFHRRVGHLRGDPGLTPADTASLEWAMAAAAAAGGDAARAGEHAERAVELLLAGPVLHVVPPASDLARILAAGARSAALERLAKGLRPFHSHPSPWLQAVISSVAGAGGDHEQLQHTVQHLEGSGRPLDLAAAREELAIAALSVGDRATALTLLDAAAEVYTAARYTLDLRRLAARARAFGVRRGSRSPHRTATTGWASVTPAERRVLDLLILGRTSRQIADALFVSPRTVESHLARLFRKLGVRTRTALVALAAREGNVT